MKKSVIGTVMVAEVALMVSVMAMNANTNSVNGSAMLAQSETQEKVAVVSQNTHNSQGGVTSERDYQIALRK